MSDETTGTPEVDAKFANVPPEELKAYLDDSAAKAGEDHDKWAFRNRLAEEKLLAKYPPADAQ